MYTHATEAGATARLTLIASEPSRTYKKSPSAEAPPLSIAPDTRVIKTLAPGQPGTRAWAHHYGTGLVCVRYRESADGNRHYTTVELVVDERINRRPKIPMASVALDCHDIETRKKIMAAGGTWHQTKKRWMLPEATAQALQLPYRRIKCT